MTTMKSSKRNKCTQ